MKTGGAFDAKTHLAALLDEVARGAEIMITKRGKPVARLVPIEAQGEDAAKDAIARLKLIRAGSSLGGLSVSELRDAGRR